MTSLMPPSSSSFLLASGALNVKLKLFTSNVAQLHFLHGARLAVTNVVSTPHNPKATFAEDAARLDTILVFQSVQGKNYPKKGFPSPDFLVYFLRTILSRI